MILLQLFMVAPQRVDLRLALIVGVDQASKRIGQFGLEVGAAIGTGRNIGVQRHLKFDSKSLSSAQGRSSGHSDTFKGQSSSPVSGGQKVAP